MRIKSYAIAAAMLFVLPVTLKADAVRLANGDVLNGKILSETPDLISFQHDILGTLQINKGQIMLPDSPKPEKENREEGVISWERKINASYAVTKGNSDTQALGGDLLVNRNRLWIDEWTLKASAQHQKADRAAIVQKADGSLRYGRSITKKVYHFYRFGIEHDYFQQIKARLTPTAGLGYWLSDTEQTKWLIEAGAGYQYELSRPKKTEGQAILHGRFFFTKQLTDRVEIGTDSYVFPEFDFDAFRIESDNFLRIKINDRFALKNSLKEKYDSNPRAGTKKNDIQLTSGLEVSF